MSQDPFQLINSQKFNYGTTPNQPVVEQNQTYFAYFDGVGGTGPEYIDGTAYFIKYLIDSDRNKETSRTFDLLSSHPSEFKFKIALVAFAYKRYSYFYKLIKDIKQTDPNFWHALSENKSLSSYLNYFNEIQSNIGELSKNRNFFTENPIGIKSVFRLPRKIIYQILDKFLYLFHIRGLVLRADQFKGIEREMD
jgi:hypothetical protein